MSENQTRTYLFIINDSPYGNERPYNALRLALNMARRPEAGVRVFLVGDGVNCAIAGQKTPDGYYNVERMLKPLARRGEVAT
ncbi:MAG: DsrE family protein [Chloroflexi bacterium]|nr:DsrE family protein [Chloroflexota bacterium]